MQGYARVSPAGLHEARHALEEAHVSPFSKIFQHFLSHETTNLKQRHKLGKPLLWFSTYIL
jgi:hypothetical protein